MMMDTTSSKETGDAWMDTDSFWVITVGQGSRDRARSALERAGADILEELELEGSVTVGFVLGDEAFRPAREEEAKRLQNALWDAGFPWVGLKQVEVDL